MIKSDVAATDGSIESGPSPATVGYCGWAGTLIRGQQLRQWRSIVKASLGGWRIRFSSASRGIADSHSVGVVLRASVNQLVWVMSRAGSLGGQPHRGSTPGVSQVTWWSWKEADLLLCYGTVQKKKKKANNNNDNKYIWQFHIINKSIIHTHTNVFFFFLSMWLFSIWYNKCSPVHIWTFCVVEMMVMEMTIFRQY